MAGITVTIDNRIGKKRVKLTLDDAVSIKDILQRLGDELSLPRRGFRRRPIKYRLLRLKPRKQLRGNRTLRDYGVGDGDELRVVSRKGGIVATALGPLLTKASNDIALELWEEVFDTLGQVQNTAPGGQVGEEFQQLWADACQKLEEAERNAPNSQRAEDLRNLRESLELEPQETADYVVDTGTDMGVPRPVLGGGAVLLLIVFWLVGFYRPFGPDPASDNTPEPSGQEEEPEGVVEEFEEDKEDDQNEKPPPSASCNDDGVCDPGETESCGDCQPDPAPVCGNENLEAGEECDLPALCGTGQQTAELEKVCASLADQCDAGYVCDDCSCQVYCGDGLCVEEAEGPDTCEADCDPVCGDGLVTHEEQCEEDSECQSGFFCGDPGTKAPCVCVLSSPPELAAPPQEENCEIFEVYDCVWDGASTWTWYKGKRCYAEDGSYTFDGPIEGPFTANQWQPNCPGPTEPELDVEPPGDDGGGAQASCGDGTCSGGEAAHTCPADCPAVCGDGHITHGEVCETNPDTCGDFTCFDCLQCFG